MLYTEAGIAEGMAAVDPGRVIVSNATTDELIVLDATSGAVQLRYTTGLNLHFFSKVAVAPCP